MTPTHNIEDYIKHAEAIVRYICGSTKMWCYYSDLRSCAMVALVSSRDTFDDTMGMAFLTYVKRSVYQAVVDELRNMFPGSRDTINMKKKIARIENSSHVKLTDEQIASKLDMNLCDYYKARYKTIDRLVQCPDMAILDNVYNDNDPLNGMLLTEMCSILKTKSKIEANVIESIYIKGLNKKNTAALLGVSEFVVCRAHYTALEHLRELLKTKSISKTTRAKRK